MEEVKKNIRAAMEMVRSERDQLDKLITVFEAYLAFTGKTVVSARRADRAVATAQVASRGTPGVVLSTDDVSSFLTRRQAAMAVKRLIEIKAAKATKSFDRPKRKMSSAQAQALAKARAVKAANDAAKREQAPAEVPPPASA